MEYSTNTSNIYQKNKTWHFCSFNRQFGIQKNKISHIHAFEGYLDRKKLYL